MTSQQVAAFRPVRFRRGYGDQRGDCCVAWDRLKDHQARAMKGQCSALVVEIGCLPVAMLKTLRSTLPWQARSPETA